MHLLSQKKYFLQKIWGLKVRLANKTPPLYIWKSIALNMNKTGGGCVLIRIVKAFRLEGNAQKGSHKAVHRFTTARY
jgi:hypothetical protein